MDIPKDIAQKFLAWIKLKIFVHLSEREIYFKHGQIWWANIGHNVGTEANGKNENFERPILILKKFNKDSLLGVTITSKPSIGPYYHEFKIKNQKHYLNLSQIRYLSAKRLIREIGEIHPTDFKEARAKIISFL